MAAVRALSVVTLTLATWAASGRTMKTSSPPESTAQTTGATARSAAASAIVSAARRAPSYVSSPASRYENGAPAAAIETDSSSSGVSPLVPTAPTTSSPTFSGMPPVRHEAPCRASAPSRPSVTCCSISRLGRTKIAAVRALSTATRELATWAPSVRRIWISSPDGSTTAITTRLPRSFAYASAAAITASAPGLSIVRRVRMARMSASFRGPNAAVVGDVEELFVRSEGEVHGARDRNVAGLGAVGREHLDAARRGAEHPAARVDLHAVRLAGSDHREDLVGAAQQVERSDVMRPFGVEAPRLLVHAAVVDIQGLLIRRE